MEQIRLTVLGEPKAQARHKHFTRGKFSGTYDPSAQKKETFASILQSQAPKELISAPISLEMVFYMSRPKNHFKTVKMGTFLKDNAPEVHTGRPDLSNLTKFVEDALNKIFYRDDALIYSINAKKIYSERPRTEIFINII